MEEEFLVTLGDVFSPAVALPEEAQGERLAAFLFGNVASKRFAHQRGHGNTLSARQDMELVVHRFFNKKCDSFHMMYSAVFDALLGGKLCIYGSGSLDSC